MRVGIVAFGFHPGETGGTESYLRNLVSGLQRYDRSNTYTLVVRKEYLEEAKNMVHSKSWRVVGLNTDYSIFVRALRKFRIISRSNESQIAAAIDRIGFDLVHFPMQTIYPYGIKAKKILTFHDMQEKHYPEFFSDEELKFRKNNYEKSAKEADKIITISNYTKEDIKKYYPMQTYDKCITVYHGTDQYKRVPTIKNISNNNEYFYYPAATWPHKNHERLLKAFARLLKKNPRYKLVLTGLKRQKSESVDKLIDKLKIGESVVIMGYLPYDELQNVFQKAYAMVYPSLFEGFGLPVLEAMYLGIPVLCSNATSLTEVAGDAAIYFNPASIKEMTMAMEKIIQDKKLRQNLIHKGHSRAKKFSIKKMIGDTINVYEQA